MRVAVLGGGRSSEHDVSLVSAATVGQGLRDAGHEVVAVELARDGTWWHDGEELALHPGRGLLDADVVFPVLHGPFGEDGTVQGLLELLDVPYVGSGVMASAVCMDKVVFKELMAQAGLPQVGYALVEAGRERPSLAHLGFPLWVKPARLGSSVGIVRVERAEDIDAALDEAFCARRPRDRRGVGGGAGDRVLRAGRHARRARVGAGRDRRCCARAGTTTRPSTPRAGCACSSRRGSRTSAREARAVDRRARRSRRRAARGWRAPTSSSTARRCC